MSIDLPDGKTATAVTALVLYPLVERIRCIKLATGQVVYDFWTDGNGEKIVRIDADAYEMALDVARERMQTEEATGQHFAASVAAQTGDPR